ncbi:MAG TPA: nuclear transport factor 2 family protein, partial [Humisphaera sp.]
YVDAFNRGDLDAVCATFAPDAQIFGVLGWGGLDVARPIWRDLIDCLQMRLEVVGVVEEGDAVAVRYVERGTSAKPFRGSPATGKGYEVTAMEWFEVRDGLIRKRWGARDSAAMGRQMGWPTA